MAKYDQKKQMVGTQYNAARDIIVVGTNRKYTQNELTVEEKELLVKAYEDEGRFLVFDNIQQAHRWVRAGTKDFMDNENPENYIYSEKYWGAFESLRRRRYVDHVSRQLYQLNYDGIQRAEELLKEAEPRGTGRSG